MPKSTKKTEAAKLPENESQLEESVAAETEEESMVPQISNFNMVLISGFGIALVVIMLMLVNGGGQSAEAALSSESPMPTPAATPQVVVETIPALPDSGEIERKGEGRHLYTTIRIPPGAETLYLSGSGASQLEDGSWGSMEQQTIDTFASFREKLESEGWSMSDIVQVRAFAVADEFGLLDFDGFNRGYREFFGTEANPMKPVRSFVQVADLVVPGWLVEIEVRAARMP